MNRTRYILGLLAGAIFILTSLMHSLIGWNAASAEFAQAGVRADFIKGLAINWHFGGIGTLAVGVVVILLFIEFRRGQRTSLLPTTIIGGLYVLFGIYALVVGDWNPFFLIFIIPGALLLAAAMLPKESP